jgi:adenosylmethionine-8-amino-7-oxononanoate aminotransferase
MVGFGRVGEWFAVNHFGVVPDLITFAKGVNSGYVPLGGVVISQRIASHFDTVAFQGGLTYSGHPLACAAGRRDVRGLRARGHPRAGARPRLARRRAPPAAMAPSTRASARCAGSACSGRSSW